MTFRLLTLALLASLLVSYAIPTLAEMTVGEQKAWDAFGPKEKATVIVWKYEDADGNLATTDDWTPIDWNVYLTNGTYTDELFALGADGSITFDGQEPSSGSINRIVTVVEADDPAWVHLNDTTSWTQVVKSGETYTVKFVNFKETFGEDPAPASSEGEPEEGEDNGPPQGMLKGLKSLKKPKKVKGPKVNSGQRGNSNVGHLYLFEKDPETWEIVRERGRNRWAKMKYIVAGPVFKFILNVHGLNASEALSLIYYPDPWPGDGLISLGNGTANNGGNLHLSGSIDTGTNLPIDSDWNNIDYDPSVHGERTEDYPEINEDYNGAKIWLVDPEDVDFENQKMVGWNPTGYLFEHDLITFTYTPPPD